MLKDFWGEFSEVWVEPNCIYYVLEHYDDVHVLTIPLPCATPQRELKHLYNKKESGLIDI